MTNSAERLISAVHLATQQLASASSLENTLREVLETCVTASGAFGGTIYIHDPATKRLRFRHVLPESVREKLPVADIPDSSGVAGEVFQSRKPQITSTCATESAGTRAKIEEATGIKTQSMLTVPLMVEGMEPIGVVQLVDKLDGEFSLMDLEVLETIGAVCAMAYINSSLGEQANRSASLMGMGKVSHDIGNLAGALHANLSFLDATVHGLGDLPAASDEVKNYAETIDAAVNDMRESINVIVGYSRLISNLSLGKQVIPDKKPGKMSEAVANAAAFLESQARRNHVALRYEIHACEQSLFDGQFVMRIVQNLVGNALKATLEGAPKGWSNTDGYKDGDYVIGEVNVTCREDRNWHVIEVTDTGPGMSEDVVARIIEGTAVSKWSVSSGSGWGTKIVKELSAAHGGEIEVESKLGVGTTFRVRLPFEPAPTVEAT